MSSTTEFVVRKSLNSLFSSNAARPILSRLDIELTERCNNNCVHCYNNLPLHDESVRGRELSAQEIKTILRDAAALGCLGVRFSGGEPLVRPDFAELYVYARRRGLRVTLFTNATLITPTIAQLFCRIRPLEPIEVSLYGMAPKTYESVTGRPGSFEAAWRGIHLLQEYKIPFAVKAVILPENKEDKEAFVRWGETLFGSSGENPVQFVLYLNLHARRDSVRNKQICARRISAEDILESLRQFRPDYSGKLAQFCRKFMKIPGENIFSCGGGINKADIDPYGRLRLCMLLKDPRLSYDLKDGSLKEAVTSLLPQWRKIKSTNPEYLRRCARCFLKGLCLQCPAKSWLEHGSLDTPIEYFCEIAHVQARSVGLLGIGEQGWEVKNGKERIASYGENN
ncbi:MAG: radical SAM protein [Candidatus Omnitrophica bacterium]|nr:radical SAM protein [Candidatus Omnitrophota bacterium]